MHELLLHGSVPKQHHHQTLSILAGLSATSSPPRILERHYIFRPAQRLSGSGYAAFPSGASQQIDAGKLSRRAVQGSEARFVRLVEGLPAEVKPTADGDEIDGMDGTERMHGATQHYEAESLSIWTLHVDETPEPGVRSQISRKTQTQVFDDIDAVETYISQQDITLVTSCLVSGHYLVYNHVLLRFYQCLRLIPHDPGAKQSIGLPLGDYERRPLDTSGAYVLEACLRIEDGTDTDVMSRGTEEMKRIREELDGCVELRAIERLSLDTRFR